METQREVTVAWPGQAGMGSRTGEWERVRGRHPQLRGPGPARRAGAAPDPRDQGPPPSDDPPRAAMQLEDAVPPAAWVPARARWALVRPASRPPSLPSVTELPFASRNQLPISRPGPPVHPILGHRAGSAHTTLPENEANAGEPELTADRGRPRVPSEGPW